MSRVDLDELEHDVEQARARFAEDLARLTSPRNLSAFKDDLWAEATQAKDQLVEKTKDAAKDGAQRILADLKERAIANPAAALAIGAGVAWRLIHRPPIASLLVGIGVVSLLRTPSQGPAARLYDEGAPPLAPEASDLVEAAQARFESAKDRVQEWTGEAGSAARDTVAQIKEAAQSATDRASRSARETVTQIKDSVASVAEQASRTTAATAKGISDRTASLAEDASRALRDAVPDQEARDRYLLGAAALAVVAALGIAFQRRAQENQ